MSVLHDLSKEIKDIVSKALPRLVHIGGDGIHFRSGIWFDGSRIVTTALAAEEGETVSVTVSGGERIETKVKAYDSRSGITVLEPDKPAEMDIWKGETPILGEAAVTVAFPSPSGPEVRFDVVRITEDEYFQTDGPAFPGFSGAAVLSAGHELLGIVQNNEQGNYGTVLPYGLLKRIVEKLSSDGSTKRRTLGVKTKSVADGLLVVDVVKDSSAHKNGILVGDILRRVDGADLKDVFDLLKALDGGAGKAVIEILRGGKKQTLEVLPDEEPETAARQWGGPRRGYGHCCR